MLRPSKIIGPAFLTFSFALLIRGVWSSPILVAVASAIYVACFVAVLFSDDNPRRDR